MRNLVLLSVLVLFLACKDEDPVVTPTVVTLTKIVIDNGQFKDANGEVFFPWGFNYTNPVDVGLIEDDWSNDVTWDIIKSDFEEMRVLGANVVRIHLQYHRFMDDASSTNTVALDRLSDLVEMAESSGLYLDITGLAAYRKGDQPNFYTMMTDEERWATQKIFWQSIAAEVGDSPAVFAFNLMNEPVVSVSCDDMNPDCEWTPGEESGGFHFVQNITRTPGNNFTTTIKAWIAEMTEGIRTEDSETLITTGFLDLGSYASFADDLDYLSPHIYPRSGELQTSIDRLEANQSAVPIVIEEIYNLNCNVTELGEFLVSIDGNYNGFMGHYFGTPIQ